MARSTRAFRIFVSSTFSDLKAERNALQERVFPRLSELCQAHGTRFQAIDLRWGVSEEAALDQQTMRICLAEIARCQQVTPRPNFVVLLGDRYGWRPLPEEIPAPEFAEIKRGITNKETQALLTAWYRRDDNGALPLYVLQPRRGEYEDYGIWAAQVERPLRAALLTAAAGIALTDEAQLKYEASATEQEITAGALQVDDASEHVFCFFRTIHGLPQDESARDFLDLDEEERPDGAAREQQQQLKDNLRRLLPGNVFEYEAGWTGDGASTDHIERLCEDVYESLSRVVLQEIAHLEEVDRLDAEIAVHVACGENLARHFTGRTAILQVVGEYLSGKSQHPLVVWGESGCGKSALIAKAVQQAQEAHRKVEVVYRFIGATPNSSSGLDLLEGLCREISRRYREDDANTTSDYRELLAEFPKRLGLATAQRPLALFLDALDQLSDTNNARNLAWLPTELPEHVRLVVSTIPSECLGTLERRLPVENRVQLQPMPPGEGAALLDLWLDRARRTLQPEQRADVLDKFERCGLPLYLRLAFEEVQRWRSYDGLPLSADNRPGLNTDVPGVIRDLFCRLSQEASHGRMLLSRSLGYLAAARNGLSEDEMLDVLSRDKDVMADFHRRSPKSPEVDRLPVVVWSRLHAEMEPYLAERTADGISLMGFYHRQLGEVAAEHLAREGKADLHRTLAEHFTSQCTYTQSDEESTANLRKLSELPYQQINGQMWPELEATLTDLAFIEAKTEAGRIFDLAEDFTQAVRKLPTQRPQLRILRLLEESVRREIHFIARHPATLFQCIWNTCWWYDCPELLDWCEPIRVTHQPSGEVPSTVGLSHLVEGQRRPWGHGCAIDHHPTDAMDGPIPFLLQSLVPPRERLGLTPRLVLAGHSGMVLSAKFSPDDKRIATAGSSDRTVRIWDALSGAELLVLGGHEDDVTCVTWSRDGDLLASGSFDGSARIWNSNSGRLEREIRAGAGITAISFAPSASLLFTGGHDLRIRQMDLETGRIGQVDTAHSGTILSLMPSPDGSLLYSTGVDNTLSIWRVSPFCLQHRVALGSVCAARLSHSPGGTQLALCERLGEAGDWRIVLRDSTSGEEIRTIATGDGASSANCVDFSPDGRQLAFNRGLRVGIVDLGSGHTVDLPGHAVTVVSVNFAQARPALLSSGGNTATVWDLVEIGDSTEELRFRFPTGQAVLSPNGQRVATVPEACPDSGSDESEKILIWNTTTARIEVELPGFCGSVRQVCWTRDGRRIVSFANTDAVVIWNIEAGQPVMVTIDGEVEQICTSLDDRFVACGCRDGSVRIVDIDIAECILTLEMEPLEDEAEEEVRPAFEMPIAFSPDMTALAAGMNPGDAMSLPRGTISDRSSIYVWDFPRGLLRHVCRGHEETVTGLAFDKHGRTLASGSQDQTVRLWDAMTGKSLRVLRGHSGCVDKVRFTTDGRHLISTQSVQAVPMTRLWDLDSGLCIRTWDGACDVDVLAAEWNAQSLSGDTLIGCNKSREFQIINPFSEEVFAAIPSGFSAQFQYSRRARVVTGCDFRHFYLYRLVSPAGTTG